MSDLISRSELIKTYCEENCGERKCVDAMDRCIFISHVLEQPTVEAVPVVRGEWKYDWLGEYICSNCYERVRVKEVMGEPAWDWCPACGADMRGDKND